MAQPGSWNSIFATASSPTVSGHLKPSNLLMNKIILFTLSLVLLFSFGSKCQSEFVINLLELKRYDSIKYHSIISFLNSYKRINASDTVIIKYDFDGETCWNGLDLQNDDYILDIINSKRKYVSDCSINRSKIKIFQFHEPGKKFNKIISWDTDIISDSSKFLYKTIFKRKSHCGSSIVLLPDGRYYIKKSDAHLEVLEYEIKNGH